MDPISKQTTATSEHSLILYTEESSQQVFEDNFGDFTEISSVFENLQHVDEAKRRLFQNFCHETGPKVRDEQLINRRIDIPNAPNVSVVKDKVTCNEQVRDFLRKELRDLESDTDRELMITMIRLFNFWLNDDRTIERAIYSLEMKHLELNDENLSKFFGRLSFCLPPLEQ